MKEVVETKSKVEAVNGRNRVTEIKYGGLVNEQGHFKLTSCIGRIFIESVASVSDRAAA